MVRHGNDGRAAAARGRGETPMDRTLRLAIPFALCTATTLLSPRAHAQNTTAENGAKATAATPPSDGERCAPGRWYTDGGCASRSSCSDERPLAHRPELLWRIDAGGPIVGEPLVWDRRVVLQVAGAKRRTLQVRSVQDGAMIAQRGSDGTGDLAPALWHAEVIVRTDPGVLDRIRIGKQGVDVAARMPKCKAVGRPLRIGSDLFAIVDGKLTCMSASDFRVRWQTPRGSCGTPSVFGDRVYCLRGAVPEQRPCVLVAYDRRSGRALVASQEFATDREVDESARIVASARRVLVWLGTTCRIARAPVNGLLFDAANLGAELRAAPMTGAPALTADFALGTFGKLDDPELLRLDDVDRGVLLANRKTQPQLLGIAPTICGNALYIGPCAVQRGELEVLWRHRDAPVTRAVAAAGRLFFVDGNELVCLGQRVPDDPVVELLDDVGSAAAQQRARAAVEAAVTAHDWERARDLLAVGRSIGVDEGWATGQERAIDRALKATGGKPKPAAAPGATTPGATTPGADAAAAADDLGLAQAGIAAQWAEIERVDPARPADWRRRALRHLLVQEPAHTGAVAAVEALLPASVKVATGFAALQWLDFLDATARAPVTFLAAPAAGGQQTAEQLALLELRDSWRPDVVAMQSRRLLVFSAIDEPGSLAKALTTGELVCDALEALFADHPRVRDDARPMPMLVYGSRNEYVRESNKVPAHRGIAAWTAGFYSRFDSRSRMFVPDDDVGFERVLPTFAHELTHQWLEDRCPAYAARDITQRRADQTGHWIVEGFASMVEQFDFDIATGRYRFEGGSTSLLDVVANAAPGQLTPWQDLVRMGAAEFAMLSPAPEKSLEMPSSLRLGIQYLPSRKQLFYAQSSALCRYLFTADDGKLRRNLLDFVVAHYTGQRDKLDFAKAFGVDAAGLGPRIVDLARELVRR
jgi:hypothetical protein